MLAPRPLPTRWTLRTLPLALVAGALLLPLTPARAQIEELHVGARVRLRAPGALAGRAEGTVVREGPDTLWVALPRAAVVPVPRAAITTAEIYRGRARGKGVRTGLRRGALWGLGFGLFNIAFSDCGGPRCDVADDVIGVALFTGIGAGIGGLIGAATKAERWERLRITARAAPAAEAR